MHITLRCGIGPGAIDALIERADFRTQPLHFRAGVAALAGECGLRFFQKTENAFFDFAQFGLRGLHRGGLGLRGEEFGGFTNRFNSVGELGKFLAQDIRKGRHQICFRCAPPGWQVHSNGIQGW